MNRLQKLGAAVAVGTVAATLSVLPAGPAAAAVPVCSELWQVRSASWAYLNFIPTPPGGNSNYCNLKNGNTGVGVRGLQRTLNQCYGKHLSIDGQFGDNTEAALRDVQGRIGVGVDGQFGPQTSSHMKWIQSANPTASSTCIPWSSNDLWFFVKRQA